MGIVKDKIELVQATFRMGKEMAEQEHDLKLLNKSLLNFPNEFISVAYEGASMGVAIKSIEQNNNLDYWNTFYQNFGLQHAAQLHVGLGWAFSELNKSFSDFDLKIEPLLKHRVLDGYGYYEGILKRRQSIRKQEFPSHFNELELRAYNQGLGRSLWYIAQGEPEKLSRLINIFSAERQSDLWRGVGIAMSYVGGIEELELLQIIKDSGEHLSAFKSGASLLIQSRTKANTVSPDTEKISNLLFNKGCSFINTVLEKLEQETASTPEEFYFDWLNKIEKEVCI